MPATIYRSIMKALDAWDYLQKTTFFEADFVDTVLEILRTARDRNPGKPCLPVGEELSLDPLRQGAPRWRGQRVNLPLTAQRILATLYEKRGQVVSYDELFQVVKSGRNRDNIRKHMADCLVQYRNYGSLCVAIGNNPSTGGSIYAAGTFASETLVPHRIGDEFLDGAHRLRVMVSLRGETYRWLAPFEPLGGKGRPRGEGTRGHFTGYLELEGRDYTGKQPVNEFRGWVWQSGTCLDATDETDGCQKQAFFSLRLPIEVLSRALLQGKRPPWPPPDLDQFQVRIEVLPPGDEPALFDSNEDGAVPPFSLNDLISLLLLGETLSIREAVSGEEVEVANLSGKGEALNPSSPLLTRLIRKLPVDTYDAPVELVDEVATPLGSYQIVLRGNARRVNKTLSAVATRVSWFVGAMLLAIVLAGWSSRPGSSVALPASPGARATCRAASRPPAASMRHAWAAASDCFSRRLLSASAASPLCVTCFSLSSSV
jgi:hypothetical protein